MLQVLDELSEIVYVCDMETYELLYMNKEGRAAFGINGEVSGKCYEVMHGRHEPCDFCMIEQLRDDTFCTVERDNEVLGKHFILKSKKIDWNGRPAKVEIMIDTTAQEETRRELRESLEFQNLINECARRLYATDQSGKNIDAVMSLIGEYLRAERIYIYEMKSLNLRNTYSWTNSSNQEDGIGKISEALIESWIDRLKKGEPVIIENAEVYRDMSPKIYSLLRGDDIASVAAVPFVRDDDFIGFMSVVNYDGQMKGERFEFLDSVCLFLAAMVRQRHSLDDLEFLSYNDPLTGLKNRNAYNMRLSKGLKFPCGIVSVDVNGMKQINEILGQKAGDSMLSGIAKKITEHFDVEDCYRMGGDEFLIIKEDISHEEFRKMARLMRNDLDRGTDVDVSSGMSWSAKNVQPERLIDEADLERADDKRNYYRNKSIRGRYRRETDDLLGISDPAYLDDLLRMGYFKIHYQPQVDATTQMIRGAEALVRYEDGKGKTYMPEQIISILEDAGIIEALDFYVFERVIKQIRMWHDEGRQLVPISTNFSRLTLADRDFIDRLIGICDVHQVSRDLITVEITESIEAENKNLFYYTVEQLNDDGFRVSVDDFGSAHANMALLTDVSFQELKIDKSVIQSVTEKEKTGKLISSLINICHNMGIKVVAEGIETEEQAVALMNMHCDLLQGFVFDKALTARKFQEKYLPLV